MSQFTTSYRGALQSILQTIALACLAALALAALTLTVLAALGVEPWLTLNASFGGHDLPKAGLYAQIGVTLLLVSLCFFVPANARMMRLERSHRSFTLSMNDVVQAYALAHKSDRAGVFTLSSEFDSVRERIAHLRQHPDLAALEPDVLEVAGQMSHVARNLARVYSDEAVARAKAFLQQRQEECAALRDLRDILPALGYDFGDAQHVDPQQNVVQMPAKPAK
ncbi:hypothetical protein GALL_492210 [mine drainage metagenome]|uniref:DNA repair protein n=1 Tax=mine drainage metagenome TaxID=410659 RepID=A0A1J5PZX8_9ZZZZ